MWEVEGNLKITTTGESFEDKQKPILGPLCLHAQRRCHQKKRLLKGDAWKGTLEPGGVGGGQPPPNWRRRPSQLCRKSCQSKPQPHSQPPCKKGMTSIFPSWPALSKRNTALSRPHLGNEAQWQHRTQHNFKDDWGTVKNILDSSFPTQFYSKRCRFPWHLYKRNAL